MSENQGLDEIRLRMAVSDRYPVLDKAIDEAVDRYMEAIPQASENDRIQREQLIRQALKKWIVRGYADLIFNVNTETVTVVEVPEEQRSLYF